MNDFSLDCCFNAVYEGLKFRESTVPVLFTVLRIRSNMVQINTDLDSRRPYTQHHLVQVGRKFKGKVRPTHLTAAF
jgi:hypothetical protein